MQGPATHPSARGAPRPSLAQRAFPRRVRALLEGVLDYVADELDRGLVTCLNELEQQLFKLAEQAKSNDLQKHCFEALREVRRGRADMIPRFLINLEAELAGIKDPPRKTAGAPQAKAELSLLEDVAMDENIVVNEIASRAEIRNSLPLFLLGQRFGVIAGRPAFDVDSLPVGPHALLRMMRDAATVLDLNGEYRQQLFRQFDRSVMQFVGPLYDALNTYLIRQRVLPYLTYVPVRAKRPESPATASRPSPRSGERGARSGATGGGAGQAGESANGRSAGTGGAQGGGSGVTGSGGAGAGGLGGGVGSGGLAGGGPAAGAASSAAGGSGGMQGAQAGGAAPSHTPGGGAGATNAPGDPSRFPAPPPTAGPRPYTAWPGTAEPASAQTQADSEMFDVLRQLLAGRRSLLGKLGNEKSVKSAVPSHVVTAKDVQNVLGNLQTKPATPVVVDGKPQARSITHLKQDMLAQLRRAVPEGTAPALPEEHGDTIDLVGMLFDHIMKDVRPNSPAAALLTKLQVPLLRVALDDKGFFTRKQHPARQMLNTIAESGQYWTSEDEADKTVVDKMHLLVDKVTRDFDGDLTLFDAMMGDLSSHMQTQARKAEVAERRHVEAARGKEKLELARLRAAEAIDVLLAGKRVPKFLHTLLAQAWADVLALSLLRGGDSSPAFRHQLQLAERLIIGNIPLADIPTLKSQIEEALAQVGYHANDSQAISNRLLAAATDEEEDDPASRTELAMRLKSRARFGGAGGATGTHEAASAEKAAPLDPAEKACYEQIRHLPFGSWFEFVTNQQGEIARRRLSWYSTVTGHCLFVNHRGQRVGEYSLSWLAREMNRGNLRVMQQESESLIDRAWSAIVGALKSFSGRGTAPAEA